MSKATVKKRLASAGVTPSKNVTVFTAFEWGNRKGEDARDAIRAWKRKNTPLLAL